MAETLTVNKNLSDEEKYKSIIPQIKSLLSREDNYISNLSNFTAAFKEAFEKISWIGFYLFDGKGLYLGPFQGKTACTYIEIGKGVCGTSAEKRETIIVPDVEEFPGHIVCDPDSKSEIVIPIVKDDRLFGVLDLDSRFYNAFNELDKLYLEEIIGFLSAEILL